MSDNLDILYQDQHLVAINKPSGLLVHRSEIDRHETRFAIQILRDQIGRRVYPVHRLDKPTSGVLLFSLDPVVARRMGVLMTSGEVQKTYLAVVRGYAPEQDVIDYPLIEELDRMTDRQARQGKEAQSAVTAYRRLATVELPFAVGRYATVRYSLLMIEPKTGRKHQIRRHMKHIFHPIVGDTTYGDGRHNEFFRKYLNSHRLLLAATKLQFHHPVSGEPVAIRAPLENDFYHIVETLGWSDVA